jgi:hypothetical protein
MNREEARKKLGQRIQRCSGCYAAYYMRDMWLGPEATYYCKNCRDDTMSHFDVFIEELDVTKLPSALTEAEDSTQCQNPFTRQV